MLLGGVLLTELSQIWFGNKVNSFQCKDMEGATHSPSYYADVSYEGLWISPNLYAELLGYLILGYMDFSEVQGAYLRCYF